MQQNSGRDSAAVSQLGLGTASSHVSCDGAMALPNPSCFKLHWAYVDYGW